MRVIETYDYEETVEINGRTYPAMCLTEDEDGMRIAVFPSLIGISAHYWAKAYDDGARMLISPSQSGWVFLTVEKFMEVRNEVSGVGYTVNEGFQLRMGEPSYREAVRLAHAPSPEEVKSSSVALKGFVHLHTHTEFSALDGLTTLDELVEQAGYNGQGAIAVTDHGRCAAHPGLQKATVKAGIKPIFGMEANFTDDRFVRGEEGVKEGPTSPKFVLYDYRHLILLAQTQAGLRNLWAMSTEANLTGFYGRPRMDWDLLERFSEGLLCSTACLRGPIPQAILADDEALAKVLIGRLTGLFPDKLWIELGCNQLPEQVKVNEALVSLANEHSLPTIAVTDSHYACHEDKLLHRIWIAAQTEKDLTDDADLFAGDQDYHLMSEGEVRAALSYLPSNIIDQSIEQTTVIASMCDATITGKRVMPIYSKSSTDDLAKAKLRDVERTVELSMKAWPKKCRGKFDMRGDPIDEDTFAARFEREMRLLIDKGYCGYYLMEWDQVSHAKGNGILVGPGRGSGAGSLVAYLLGITEIDPIKYDLMFERFLTEERDSPPDFDVDYPSSKRHFMQDYCVERWGSEYVMRVGTHQRFKNRGIIRKLATVLQSTIDFHFPDINAICKLAEQADAGTAGAGMPWADFMDEYEEELAPYIKKYPELFSVAEKLVKRLSSYGRHAAGLVIATDETLTGRFPMRRSGDEEANQPISEFDMKALEELGLLKFDLLTLRTLDTLQMCIDLIRERYGHEINVYEWDQEYEDPQVWSEISDGHTLGMFQMESRALTKLAKRFRPENIGHLADIETLVRPGPTRSGLTEQYFRRKAGIEAVEYIDPRLETVLKPTYGVIVYQEQVMAVCQVLAGYSLAEADDIRRLMGKKEVEKVQAAGVEFVNRCAERGMDRGEAEALWAKLGEFAKYSFNLSHAVSYAVIGYWCQWLKVHYPSMFFTAALSTVKNERIPEFVKEARRMGFKVLPPDINASKESFQPTDGITVRYGFRAIGGIAEASCDAVLQGQPYTSFDDFMERKGSACDIGKVETLARIGAFDSIFPNRHALVSELAWKRDPESTRCVNKDTTVTGAPNGLPCTYNWAEEPVELTLKGKEKKRKDPPKKCTKACRRYTPIEKQNFDDLRMFTDKEVREVEKELLGIYLSSTPFDRFSDEHREECARAMEIDGAPVTEPPTEYLYIGLVTSIRERADRTGAKMAFVTLEDEDGGTVDVAIFKDDWAKLRAMLQPDTLAVFRVRKTDRGVNLMKCIPVT